MRAATLVHVQQRLPFMAQLQGAKLLALRQPCEEAYCPRYLSVMLVAEALHC